MNTEGARMAEVLVGTAEGIFSLSALSPHASPGSPQLAGTQVSWLSAEGASLWAIAGQHSLRHRDASGAWTEVADVSGVEATCILPATDGVLIGTAGAHLLRLHGSSLERVGSFDEIPTRSSWYTPWGGPPDTRSLAEGPGGLLYANVHVGGILRSTDAGRSWEQTSLDVDADVHQVQSPARGFVLAATALGLAISANAGWTWRFAAAGLHGTYLRAVTVAGDQVLVSASESFRGEVAAVYRRPIGGRAPFTRCRSGLPKWFSANIDTGCLAALGNAAAFGTADGSVFASTDCGRTWSELASGLPAIKSILIAPH